MSSRPDCIFEIHQRWQSGFSRVYSNCCCSCSFELEIIKIGQSSHKIYSNSILNFQESMTILNACTKKVWNLTEGTTYMCFYFCSYIISHVTLKSLLGLIMYFSAFCICLSYLEFQKYIIWSKRAFLLHTHYGEVPFLVSS